MTAAKGLRAVAEGETAPSKAPRKTIAQAARDGDHRGTLVAMRDRIAKTLDGDVPPRDLASLTKRLDDIVEKIKTLDAAEDSDAGSDEGTADDTFDASAI